jgi:hypothetical protein
MKLMECAHEAHRLFQEGRWVAPLHEDEPPGLGTSKAVTRYAHRQRTPHSGESAQLSSPAHSGDSLNAESNSEYKYENVQTALDEYIQSWTAGTASSTGLVPDGGPVMSPRTNAPIQPPTSDAFLQGLLTGNWEMPSAEETLCGRGFAANGHFPATTPNLPNAPPVGVYDLPPTQNLGSVKLGSAAPTTVPPLFPQNARMTYSGPPIVQQQPQLESQVPQAQPASVDAFNSLYGSSFVGSGDAPADLTHQEAIFNAGVWGDLMTNFGLNQ